jgi:riboflavin biosynthesis pyrimidine reductase
MPLRQLYPIATDGGDVDLVAAYTPELDQWRATRPKGASARPWTRVNMVTSVDGAVTVSGRSGGLSDDIDKQIFRLLRFMADAVLVGAGTVRAERYGPARIPDDIADQRVARGQAAIPPIVVVSASGELDPGLPLLDPDLVGDGPVPIIVTCAGNEPVVRKLGGRAEALVAGDGAVDLALAMQLLGERGIEVVVSEGGPILNASMVHAGLLDEMCLTVSPLTVAGDAARIVGGNHEFPTPAPMELAHIIEADSTLYTRWRYPHAAAD